jgi:hypothetical protein
MHKITFVSTVHQELGKCNADELHNIIVKISPEVIFLEALDATYSNYEKYLFSSFGVCHKKLEINAIQQYNCNTSFKYVPVLDNGLSDAFEKKYSSVCERTEFQKLLDNFNSLAGTRGFQFLNSAESISIQEEMRLLGDRLLNDSGLNKAANEDIDAYENSMIRNIYSYCSKSQFDRAIFMCGVAHRKSIIEKVEKFNNQGEMRLNWVIFES